MAHSTVRLVQRPWPAAPRSLAEAALDSLPDAVVCVDLAGRITFTNIAAQRLTGCSRAAAAGRRLRDFVQVDDVAGATTLFRLDGEPVWVETSPAPLRDERGKRVGTVVTVRDVSRDREAVRQLLFRAHHDALTGLPNRALLDERLTAALATASATGVPLAVCFLDVDGLKSVNDVFGHGAGDQVLTTTAARLAALAGPDATVSRYAGDDLVVVLAGLAAPEQARARAAALARAVAAPHTVGAHAVHVAASLGLAHFPTHGDTADALIASADAAMYAAKRAGGGHREAGAEVAQLAGAWRGAAPRAFVARRRRLTSGAAAPRRRAV